MAVDAKSEFPLAVIVAPANDNEKKHAPALFKKALRATQKENETVDCGFSVFLQGSENRHPRQAFRVVIPYPANQMRGQKGLLRVDRFFRTHGPKREKRLYRLRSSIERVNSRLKEQLCLENHRVRSLVRVKIHSLFCLVAMLLNAVAAVRLKAVDKARSITLLAK